MELQELVNKIQQTFRNCPPETISITLYLWGCLPKSMDIDEFNRVTECRLRLFKRLEEVSDEIVRVEELFTNHIGRGICP
jgi:hypothetical protein